MATVGVSFRASRANGSTHSEGGLLDGGGSDRLDSRGDRAGRLLSRLVNVIQDVLGVADGGKGAEGEKRGSAHCDVRDMSGGSENRLELREEGNEGKEGESGVVSLGSGEERPWWYI